MSHYRADIDGLRAIAVVAVVLGHAGFAGFSGGFLGVDVFFVLSGYLITQILLREDTAGGISLVRFYERRVRRIVPALAVMLAACSLAALILFSPYELRDYANSLIASVAFVANLFFMTATDYWSPRYETPLLHLWSLGVEEQFYIFYPLLLAFLLKAKRRAKLLPVLLILSLLSLVFAEMMARQFLPPASRFWFAGAPDWAKTAAFYFTGTRAWELLAGAMTAMLAWPKMPGWLRQACAGVALAAIVIPIPLYHANLPWPGLLALPPVLGTAVLLGLHARHRTWVSALCSLRPMVMVGLISYSLYLWHWPIFEFYRRFVLRPVSDGEHAVLIALAVLAAFLSWRFVEQPFRRPRNGIARRPLFRAAAASALVLLLFSGTALALHGLPQRFSPQVRTIYAQLEANTPLSPQMAWLKALQGCYVRNRGPAYDFDRCFKLSQSQPNIVIWGDSLAGTYMPGLVQQARLAGVQVALASKFDCRPVLTPGAVSDECLAFNRQIMAHLDGRIRAVVISARFYLNPELLPALQDTVRQIAAKGIRVIVMGPALEYRLPGPFYVARHAQTGDAAMLDSRRSLKPDYAAFNARMGALFSGMPGVTYVSVPDRVCPQSRCPMLVGDMPVQRDFVHLTPEGSVLLGGIIWPPLLRSLMDPLPSRLNAARRG